MPIRNEHNLILYFKFLVDHVPSKQFKGPYIDVHPMKFGYISRIGFDPNMRLFKLVVLSVP